MLARGAAAELAVDSATRSPPNIVLILADDLGYGDLGCYGQRRIRTPHLDRLAAEGIRYRQCYAGSTVCAPSRCALMTGRHMGHARIRGNSELPLAAEDVTLGEVLQSAGYVTGAVGKWGLGEAGSPGVPTRQGFGTWFGYLNQVHAHNYYPDFLWRDEMRVEIEGNRNDQRQQYSPDLMVEEALRFLDARGRERFFLYLAFTLPHANNERGRLTGNGMEVPDAGPYRDEPWPEPQRNHAAMITRLDAAVGQVLTRLEALGVAERTLVLFSSDNGPPQEGGADPAFFHSSGGLRGWKRDLYEGGIRVPMLVRWPARIPAGQTSDLVWAFWDVLPTLAEVAGASRPAELDGVSIASSWQSPPADALTAVHSGLYWEFHERGFEQAARWGRWKGVRHAPNGALELYDLSTDPGEQHDVSAEHPAEVAQIVEYLRTARSESPDWPIREKR